MSFDDVAKRMQQRHSEGWIPKSEPYPLMAPSTPSALTDARGRAEIEAQFAKASGAIPSAVVVPPGARSAPTPASRQPPLQSFQQQEESSGDILMRMARDEQRRSAKSDMLIGAVMCAFGIIVTAATFSSASTGGGTYVIAWGPAIFGAIRFFRGLSRLA
ncbi:MAG TPA: hypothetical protein VGM39_06685 [Kofleriaceae bacterium]|jgi:hypothetical protein